MKKVVFLDRDGTINVDNGYVYRLEDWQWAPGAIEGMKLLQRDGFALTVITNQSAIAAGKYTADDVHRLHAYMEEELKKEGITITAIAFCPHGRDQDDCDCRKPKIGMATQIGAKVGKIDYAGSWTIGDKEADVGFGKHAGTKTALLRSRYWIEPELKAKPDFTAENLLEAAQKILDSK